MVSPLILNIITKMVSWWNKAIWKLLNLFKNSETLTMAYDNRLHITFWIVSSIWPSAIWAIIFCRVYLFSFLIYVRIFEYTFWWLVNLRCSFSYSFLLRFCSISYSFSCAFDFLHFFLSYAPVCFFGTLDIHPQQEKLLYMCKQQ